MNQKLHNSNITLAENNRNIAEIVTQLDPSPQAKKTLEEAEEKLEQAKHPDPLSDAIAERLTNVLDAELHSNSENGEGGEREEVEAEEKEGEKPNEEKEQKERLEKEQKEKEKLEKLEK